MKAIITFTLLITLLNATLAQQFKVYKLCEMDKSLIGTTVNGKFSYFPAFKETAEGLAAYKYEEKYSVIFSEGGIIVKSRHKNIQMIDNFFEQIKVECKQELPEKKEVQPAKPKADQSGQNSEKPKAAEIAPEQSKPAVPGTPKN